MASTLTIAGTAIDRAAAKVVLDRLTLSLDRPDELEFHEVAADLPGTYAPEQAVTLTDGATLVFQGWIFSRSIGGFGESSGRVGYRCVGLSYGAALVAVTASDGTGTMAFNLPITDGNYSEAEAGLSVGTIIGQVLSQHGSQLAAIGITTDATTTTQLAALAVVSPDPVYVSGNSVWGQLQQLLQVWYGNRYALRIEATGLVRCHDTYALTTETITLDQDPAILTSLTEDTQECYTQVVLRGRADIEPAYLSLAAGTLAKGWTAAEEASWTIASYLDPSNGTQPAWDQGTITALTSTVVTVKSANGALTWPVNYWSGIQGQIALINTVVTGLTGFEYRNITACSALSAGGTATITLDRPLANSGYTSYKIVAVDPTGESLVWRKFTIPNTYVAQHLQQAFNHSVPFYASMSAVAQVTGPVGVIEYSGFGFTGNKQPLNFELVPDDGTNDGYVLCYQPVVMFCNTNAALAAGGSSVVPPTDVIAMVPYSRGTMTVTSPSGGGHGGTAFTAFGVQRTLYRDYPSWIDAGNSSSMQTLADNILQTVCNATREGSLTYFDKYTAALPSGSWPIALNVAKAAGTTGYEGLNAPVRTVTLEWPQEGGAIWRTTLGFSTRRQMYSGDRLYVHPMFAAGGFLAGPGIAAKAPTFGGITGPVLGDTGAGPAPAMGPAEVPAPRRRRRSTRLRSGEERFRSARAHDLADRQARERSESRAQEAEVQKDFDQENTENLVRTDNRRRARVLAPAAEGPHQGDRAERANRERLVRSDNRRRARTLESPDDRAVRLAYGPGGGWDGGAPADPSTSIDLAKAD